MQKFIQLTELTDDTSLAVKVELNHIVSFGAIANAPHTLMKLEGGHTMTIQESIGQVMDLINRYGK